MASGPPRCNKRKGAQKAKMSLRSARNMSPMVNVATQSASRYAIQSEIQMIHFPPLCFLNGATKIRKDCSKRLRIISPLIFQVSHSFWTWSAMSSSILFNLLYFVMPRPTHLGMHNESSSTTTSQIGYPTSIDKEMICTGLI
ncbi:hypothetical protein SLA2020_081000 [Shorea laevis]